MKTRLVANALSLLAQTSRPVLFGVGPGYFFEPESDDTPIKNAKGDGDKKEDNDGDSLSAEELRTQLQRERASNKANRDAANELKTVRAELDRLKQEAAEREQAELEETGKYKEALDALKAEHAELRDEHESLKDKQARSAAEQHLIGAARKAGMAEPIEDIVRLVDLEAFMADDKADADEVVGEALKKRPHLIGNTANGAPPPDPKKKRSGNQGVNPVSALYQKQFARKGG